MHLYEVHYIYYGFPKKRYVKLVTADSHSSAKSIVRRLEKGIPIASYLMEATNAETRD